MADKILIIKVYYIPCVFCLMLKLIAHKRFCLTQIRYVSVQLTVFILKVLDNNF